MSETRSLQHYVSLAVHGGWEDHDSLDPKGKELVDIPDGSGRRDTRLNAQVMNHMHEAVERWCGNHPDLGVRVYTPRGHHDYGNEFKIIHSLWFSGLWGHHVYQAFADVDIASGNTPGYGVAFAITEGAVAYPRFYDICGAGLVRFDTGLTLSRGDSGKTWIGSKRMAECGLPIMEKVPSGITKWDPSAHIILADTQFQQAIPFGIYDTGSSFGNAFNVLAGNVMTVDDITAPAVAAIAAFGYALPAVYYLALGSAGDMMFPGYRHVGPQLITELIGEATYGPAVLGSQTGVALSIVGKMAEMAQLAE